MSHRSFLLLLLSASTLSLSLFAAPRKIDPPVLTPQKSGTTQLLIAVWPVDSRVVWASGAGGTYVVTTDGGEHWRSGVVPGAEALQFRDVYAVSDKVAYLLSIGDNTTDFKIYKTVDGGKHWHVEFTNETTNAFYDCFAFWSPDRGLAHSDSVNGIFPELKTWNGWTWHSIANHMPPALAGEASFSSSGTCITTQGHDNAWIATGGSSTARILATRDGGYTWNAFDTPLVSSPSGGGFSVAFRDPWNGIVGGGDLSTNADADAAVSHDGGRTWTLTTKPPVTGAIFALAYTSGTQHRFDDWFGFGDDDRRVVVTSEALPDFSTGQAAWSPDEGRTWNVIPKVSGYWSVAFANPQAGWFVGNNGSILKISFEDHDRD